MPSRGMVNRGAYLVDRKAIENAMRLQFERMAYDEIMSD